MRKCRKKGCTHEALRWQQWCGFHTPLPPSDPEIVAQLDKERREAGR